MGSDTAEEVVTRILLKAATFSTAATVNRDAVAKASTYAVGRSSSQVAREWPLPASSGCSEDAKLSSPDGLQARVEACCNHIAYARTCVQLELHKSILLSSQELQLSVNSFAAVVKEADKQDNPWPYVLANDAPTVLGHVFLACLGALVMDSGYRDAAKVLGTHVEKCLSMPLPAIVLVCLSEKAARLRQKLI